MDSYYSNPLPGEKTAILQFLTQRAYSGCFGSVNGAGPLDLFLSSVFGSTGRVAGAGPFGFTSLMLIAVYSITKWSLIF